MRTAKQQARAAVRPPGVERGGATCLFHLDEPADSLQVEDSSGSGLVGDISGGVTLGVQGRFSTAAEFDGSSGSEIAVPDAKELEVGDSPFTLEAWVKPDALVAGVASAILSKWCAVEGPEGSEAMSYLLLVNAEGKLEGRVWDPGTEAAVVVVSDDALPIPEVGQEGEWVHVALERDSTGELALYVYDTKQADVAAAAFALADTGESFRIGAAGNVVEGDAADGMYFVGAIDEVRLSVMTAGTPARGEAGSLGLVVVNYVYNARNQLVTETSGASEKIYCYDPNGNVRFITETVGGVEASVEEMTYDELNRMLTHTGPKGTETFTYRGAAWHRASANGTQFLYDGDNVIADIGAGGIDAFYVTPFLDQNLSMTKDGSTYYYSEDGLSSVRTLTDAAGGAVNRYDYLPFGGSYQPGTSVTVEQRYTYTGREKNPESSLMYYRYRQYDPRVGRFGGRDLVGYAQGPGLYGYVGGMATARFDPLGLQECKCCCVDSLRLNLAGPIEGEYGMSDYYPWTIMEGREYWSEQAEEFTGPVEEPHSEYPGVATVQWTFQVIGDCHFIDDDTLAKEDCSFRQLVSNSEHGEGVWWDDYAQGGFDPDLSAGVIMPQQSQRKGCREELGECRYSWLDTPVFLHPDVFERSAWSEFIFEFSSAPNCNCTYQRISAGLRLETSVDGIIDAQQHLPPYPRPAVGPYPGAARPRPAP